MLLEAVRTGPPQSEGNWSRDPSRLSKWLLGASLITLFLLLGFARAGAPRVPLALVTGVYLLTAVAWSVALVLEHRREQITLPKRGAVWTMVGVGLALLALARVVSHYDLGGPVDSWRSPARVSGTLLFAGVLILYLAVGFAVARSRAWVGRGSVQQDLKGHRGTGEPGSLARIWFSCTRARGLITAMGLMVVAVLWGLGGLGDVPYSVSAFALVSGCVFFPAALSMLSEHAVNWFAEYKGLARLTSVSGFVLVALACWFSYARWGNLLSVVALAALAVLMICLASSTLLDIAIVLAVMALVGATPPGDDPPPTPGSDADSILVALGDSYMSGEGAERYIGGTDVAGANECRRATTAWATLASQAEPFDGLQFHACSGADSFNIRLPGPMTPEPKGTPAGDPTQLEQYLKVADDDPPPALVVLSVGGNDAGFSTIGLTCMAPGDCDDPVPSSLWSEGNLNRLENRLRQVYADVATTFPDSPVAVIPYPDPIDEAGVPCDSADLSKGDVRFIEKFLARLNERIKQTSAEYNFSYVEGMETALEDANIQLCSSNDQEKPGINFLGLRSVQGSADQRFNPGNWLHNSLHPNKRGHQALYAAFERWLTGKEGVEALTKRPHDSATHAVSETYSNTGDDCANYEAGDDCISRSRAWSAREAGVFALERGWLALLLMGVAWAGMVAAMGSLARARA